MELRWHKVLKTYKAGWRKWFHFPYLVYYLEYKDNGEWKPVSVEFDIEYQDCKS